MAGPFERLVPARLAFDARGVPFSEHYGDVYHSAAGAFAQARHVFLGGNGLPGRWRDRSDFTVCETGFGLGQNFLATWQAWRDDPRRCARLHYLAFEAHPFAASDLARALTAAVPAESRALADALVQAWPPLLPGVHRMDFQGGALSLTLFFGPVQRMARQAEALVDAFFLDGFSPALNPEMWTPALFSQLRRLGAAGATAASWCVAGAVRRDLQAAGFLVDKAPGFGAKRDMMVAALRPGLGRSRPQAARRRVAVVGAGLAGAGMAWSLAQRGHAVEVFDPILASGGPGGEDRRAGALVPALTPDDDTRARLSRAGLARAHARWMDLAPAARPRACGALVCASHPREARKQRAMVDALAFPDSWVAWLDPRSASERAGLPLQAGGLYFPHALRVPVDRLARALVATPGIAQRGQRIASLAPRPDGSWLLRDDSGAACGLADEVVLANALHAGALLASCAGLDPWPRLAGMDALAGQISLYPAPADGTHPAVPRCILAGQGYCLPPDEGWAILGSTYRKGGGAPRADARGHAEIRARLAAWLPLGWIPWTQAASPDGWAGWRAATADHLPLIGPLQGVPGLWLACGYGSRGLSWSALAGELMAALLDAEPLPLERELIARIAPR